MRQQGPSQKNGGVVAIGNFRINKNASKLSEHNQ